MSNLDKVPFFTGLRRMIYAVTLNETSFETLEEVPSIMNEATSFFWMFMFMESSISVLKQDKRCRLNDMFTSISAGMVCKLPRIFVRGITMEGYVWVHNNYRMVELPWDSAWTWWLTFFGVDLFYYWFHRMAHEVNVVWALHQTHHSSEYYNTTTALRQSALQGYSAWVFYLPLALCIPPSIFLVHFELSILYQFWIHTEYIKSLGPLEYILNTPSHHRVHHGRNPYCIDKNYAGTLIIWDRLFRTFAKENEAVAYGLTDPINTFEPFAIQFGYLQFLAGRVFEQEGLINKIKTVLYGPGWSPGKPRTGDINDIPQVETTVKQYNIILPTWISVYVLVHFLISVVGYQELMARQFALSQTSVYFFAVYCFINLTCMGRLLDESRTAWMYEMVRCALFIIGDIVMYQVGFYGERGYRPVFLYGFQFVFAFSMALAIVQMMREDEDSINTFVQEDNGIIKDSMKDTAMDKKDK